MGTPGGGGLMRMSRKAGLLGDSQRLIRMVFDQPGWWDWYIPEGAAVYYSGVPEQGYSAPFYLDIRGGGDGAEHFGGEHGIPLGGMGGMGPDGLYVGGPGEASVIYYSYRGTQQVLFTAAGGVASGPNGKITMSFYIGANEAEVY